MLTTGLLLCTSPPSDEEPLDFTLVVFVFEASTSSDVDDFNMSLARRRPMPAANTAVAEPRRLAVAGVYINSVSNCVILEDGDDDEDDKDEEEDDEEEELSDIFRPPFAAAAAAYENLLL